MRKWQINYKIVTFVELMRKMRLWGNQVTSFRRETSPSEEKWASQLSPLWQSMGKRGTATVHVGRRNQLNCNTKSMCGWVCKSGKTEVEEEFPLSYKLSSTDFHWVLTRNIVGRVGGWPSWAHLWGPGRGRQSMDVGDTKCHWFPWIFLL